jgi:uncharacterized repeat protein (TIGR03803 family)
MNTLALAGLCLAMAACAQAQDYFVLHSFRGGDGAKPSSDLVRDSTGNLYGTTVYGGAYRNGVVFMRDNRGHFGVLHDFTGGADGAAPNAVIVDSAGNLYGTTNRGGDAQCNCGVIFKLDPAGNFTVLHTFTGPDGANPVGRLIREASGDLYGTAPISSNSNGVVFRLDSTGAFTVLHDFDGKDGAYPYAGVVRDSAGNLYGAAYTGGAYDLGVIFKLDPARKFTVLHTFTGQADGANPETGVIRDPAGNLYGLTSCCVFKLDPAGNLTVLHGFTGGPEGSYARGGLVRDFYGNLYGTAVQGGTRLRAGNPGPGMVYKIEPTGVFTVLHTFHREAGGRHPWAGLIVSSGTLYGTTTVGGTDGYGAIFKLR